MSPREFNDLLCDWAVYVSKGNRFPLGYVTSHFGEYIPRGAYGNDPIDKILPDVLEWNAFFTSEAMPEEFRVVLWIEYVESKVVRTRLVGGQIKSGQWKYRLSAAKTAALAMFKARSNSVTREFATAD